MPAPLIECVPNFSEGRNAATIEALRAALTSVPGVRLLDVQADASHTHSVFTFVAPPDAALEPALPPWRVPTERTSMITRPLPAAGSDRSRKGAVGPAPQSGREPAVPPYRCGFFAMLNRFAKRRYAPGTPSGSSR